MNQPSLPELSPVERWVKEFAAKVAAEQVGPYVKPAHVSDEDKKAAFKILASGRGMRYVQCTLDNFASDDAEAKDVQAVSQLRLFARDLGANCHAGQANLLLLGPPGTGKDHLLMAMMREAIVRYGYSVEWYDGLELYANIRRGGFENAYGIVDGACKPQILAISDPVPPKGELGNYDLSVLRRIIERRYSRMMATWVTTNVTSREDAQSLFSAAVLDRLIDGATQVTCNWQSYRRLVRTDANDLEHGVSDASKPT